MGLPQDIIIAWTKLGSHGLLACRRTLPWPRGGAAKRGSICLPCRPPPAPGPEEILCAHHLVSTIVDGIQADAGLAEQHPTTPPRRWRGWRAGVDGATAAERGHPSTTRPARCPVRACDKSTTRAASSSGASAHRGRRAAEKITTSQTQLKLVGWGGSKARQGKQG